MFLTFFNVVRITTEGGFIWYITWSFRWLLVVSDFAWKQKKVYITPEYKVPHIFSNGRNNKNLKKSVLKKSYINKLFITFFVAELTWHLPLFES